ncbi:MAG: alanine--glyoxylate aminotransferase [Nitrospirales bacterium]|nr:MAG: alanine--glyoxylate aminotransferase [Nitrospirales bacterium]
MIHPRVLQAMSTPLVGHLDPEFLSIMDDIQDSLRWLFQTHNTLTIPISGTGSAAMEAAIVNLVEPGDSVIVGINGIFGTRLASMVERCGGHAIRLEVPWGQPLDPAHIEHHLITTPSIKAVAVVHAETSTGVYQPLEHIGQLCQQHEALYIVDTVTSLGGMEVNVDAWHIDACYSATQKCLSCPPGVAPLTFSDRAVQSIRQRQAVCTSWYLDCSLISDYWSESKRTYHHTAPISMAYALREALRLIQEEGLAVRIARHRRNSLALMAGLKTLGFEPLADEPNQLTSLLCVKLPAFVDDLKIRKALLQEFHIEIGGGLGPLAGKVWRIGLMGESSREEYIMALLSALEQLLARQTDHRSMGTSTAAAMAVWTQSQHISAQPATLPSGF